MAIPSSRRRRQLFRSGNDAASEKRRAERDPERQTRSSHRSTPRTHRRLAGGSVRSLTRTEAGKVEWLEVPEPRLEKGCQALVRPLVVTLCDIDRPMADGRFPIPGAIALGHEFVGAVVEVGDAVRTVRPGDRVIVPFQISCGVCDRCKAGLTAHCRATPPRSQYGFGVVGGEHGGAFSDLVRVPFADGMLVHVPHGVPLEALACASDNLGDGWRAVAPELARRPGADVLVIGGIGSVPLYAVAVARACGAGRLDYLDADRTRLEVAEALGARALEGPIPESAGEYDLVVDGTLLDPRGLACALRSLRPDGLCVGVTIYLADPHVPYFEMYSKGVRFETGRVQARAAMTPVLDLVQAGRVDPTRINGAVLPWEAAPDAFAGDVLKPVFVRE
jgi:threonine dehydrogenase-like Zn-dependent dehydrogenase